RPAEFLLTVVDVEDLTLLIGLGEFDRAWNSVGIEFRIAINGRLSDDLDEAVPQPARPQGLHAGVAHAARPLHFAAIDGEIDLSVAGIAGGNLELCTE